jgi:RNA polymerase sigma factor (sigma-70 family)
MLEGVTKMAANVVAGELLSEEEERQLGLSIELGVLARQVLAGELQPGDATQGELRRVAAEGKQAWRRFLLANVRLVASMAWGEAVRHGLDAEDLFQEGFVALADALRRYDYRRARFSTFAYQRVKQHLSTLACSRMGELPMSPTMALERSRMIRLIQRSDQGHGSAQAVAEAARLLGQDVERVRRVVATGTSVSLYEDDRILSLPVDVDFEAGFERESVERGLRTLSAVEREVICLRYGFDSQPMTIAQVSERLALSPSGVRRTEARALQKLRHAINAGQ